MSPCATPIHARIVTGLTVCWSHADHDGCHELMTSTALSCPEHTVLVWSSLMRVLTTFPMHCGDGLGEGGDIDVLFVDEHTTDAYSLHFVKLRVSV